MSAAIFPPLPLRAYRGPCIAMLRRYYAMSHELGRLPSVLGRELFRPQITTIHEAWFEDSVIFVCDVEHCVEMLHAKHREIVKRLVFQEYTQEELADMLHVTDRHIRRLLLDAVDTLSQIFLDRDLMILPQRRRHMMAYDVLLEDPDEEPSCQKLSDALEGPDSPTICACDETGAHPFRGRTPITQPWQTFPVEISCQAPWTSQIASTL